MNLLLVISVGFLTNAFHYNTCAIRLPAESAPKVVRVTSLADRGAGTLRDALNMKHARVIVFDVAGAIRIDGPLMVRNGYAQVLGQTAPAPGITVIGAGIHVAAPFVGLEHLRIRVEPSDRIPPSANDGISILAGASHVWADHVSVTGAIDEGIGI